MQGKEGSAASCAMVSLQNQSKDIPLHNLPHQTTEGLSRLFDPPGLLDWKKMVENFPERYTYKTYEVREIEELQKQHRKSPTGILFDHLQKRGFTAGDLREVLEKMNHNWGLQILENGLQTLSQQHLFKKPLRQQEPEKRPEWNGVECTRPIQVQEEQENHTNSQREQAETLELFQSNEPKQRSLGSKDWKLRSKSVQVSPEQGIQEQAKTLQDRHADPEPEDTSDAWYLLDLLKRVSGPFAWCFAPEKFSLVPAEQF